MLWCLNLIINWFQIRQLEPHHPVVNGSLTIRDQDHQLLHFSNGEFDSGSGRTLAACLTHASRTMKPSLLGGLVANG